MPKDRLEDGLVQVVRRYQRAFAAKEFATQADDLDPLMLMFGITQEVKDANKQYWGRELGMCWQRLVVTVAQERCRGFAPALRIGDDEPCDLRIDRMAIDTKYRSGNGDSGTLKKFRSYGPRLKEAGYEPVMLFLRSDNLPAAMTAIRSGGWRVLAGDDAFRFLKDQTGFDLRGWLDRAAGRFSISDLVKTNASQ